MSYLTKQPAKLTVQVGTGRNYLRREKASYLLMLGACNSWSWESFPLLTRCKRFCSVLHLYFLLHISFYTIDLLFLKKKKKLCLFGMCGSHGLFHTSAAVCNSKLLCSVTCLVCFTLSSHLPMCDSSRLRKHKMWKKTEHMKTVVLRLHFLTDWNGTQVCCMKDIVL